MRKKGIIIAGFIAILAAAFLLMSNRMARIEDEENMLLYDKGGCEEVVADLAIQGEEGILYIRKIKLILDNPTLGDMIDAVNANDEGVHIQLDDKGEIRQIDAYKKNRESYWKILLDNKSVDQRNVRQIPVENYQGITFLWVS